MKKAEAALQVELWDLDKIFPHPRNAKIHSNEQVETLARLIKQYGWTQPIVIDQNGFIIAGHGRRLAAMHLKKERVPVVCRRDLTEAECDAMRLSDNRVTSVDYDMRLVQGEISKLFEADFDMSLTAFNEKELEFLTTDHEALDESAFILDVSEAVEVQRDDNKAAQEKLDVSSAPVGDALGFKRVTIAQSRRLRAFMIKIEGETGLKGVDALFNHLEKLGA